MRVTKAINENRDSGAISWGMPAAGLRLGLSTKSGTAELSLQNVGEAALEVLSHVQAHEVHLDWNKLRLTNDSGLDRSLGMVDARDRSIPIRIHLEPGESRQNQVDVQEWAKRPINGTQPLAPGNYQLFATYDVANEKDCWLGHLEAGPATLAISGKNGDYLSPTNSVSEERGRG